MSDNFIDTQVVVKEIARTGNRVLTEVTINKRRTGYVETRLSDNNEPLLQFALGNDKRAARKQFDACLDRSRPIPIVRQTQPERAMRRQGKSAKPETLAIGDSVLGCVYRTYAEKGYSFFTIIGRIENGTYRPFDKKRQPELFIHDSNVPEALRHDLDTPDLTYAIDVRDGKLPGKLEGRVSGLNNVVELQQAA